MTTGPKYVITFARNCTTAFASSVTGLVPTREHCGERSAVGCVVMGGKGWAGLGLGGGRRGIVGGGVRGGMRGGGRGKLGSVSGGLFSSLLV